VSASVPAAPQVWNVAHPWQTGSYRNQTSPLLEAQLAEPSVRAPVLSENSGKGSTGSACEQKSLPGLQAR
jgi:hypothetical protein